MFRPELLCDLKLETLVMDYQIVIKDSEERCNQSVPSSREFFTFYAMKSAYLLVSLLEAEDFNLHESGLLSRNLGDGYVDEVQMPRLSDVVKLSSSTIEAFESGDQVSLLRLLQEIGVFDLCPRADEQLERMGRFSKRVGGIARLALLVELVRFASELLEHDALRGFLQEAWEWMPSGWELYNLYIAEGILLLDSEDWRGAVSCLEKSTDACLTDGSTSLSCGLRAPNFRLADGLLKAGYRASVLKHLAECQDIWRLRWMPMRDWIRAIESGETPDFLNSSVVAGMNLPSCRMFLQWMHTQTLVADYAAQAPRMAKSRQEVMDERKMLTEDGRRFLSKRIKESLARESERIDQEES
jgi:hypothetical protein